LERLSHREVEVINFLPNDEADTADHVRAFVAIVALNIKNLPPQTPVRINAEENLANSDKDQEMENGIRSQVPELNSVEKEERTKKFVGWKRKPTLQKSNEHDGETLRRLWARNETWMDEISLDRGDEP
jgi:hypothetical protein